MKKDDFALRNWQIISHGLNCQLGQAERRSVTQLHRHSYREILICLEGTCPYHYSGQRYQCNGGTAFFFDVQEWHDSGYRQGNSAFYHLWFSLSNQDIYIHTVRRRKSESQLFEEFRLLLPDPQLAASLNRLWPQSRLRINYSASALQQRLQTCIQYLFCCCYDSIFVSKSKAGEQDPFLMVKRHIRETAGCGENLETLAAMTGYSKFHFLREFKKHNGLTVLNYINQCRREKVEQLQQQGITKKVMADILGFSNASSFSRWLKNQRIGF